jgi:hypothetical protein
MDDAERKALICSMSVGWFALGDIYNSMKSRQRTEFSREHEIRIRTSLEFPHPADMGIRGKPS